MAVDRVDESSVESLGSNAGIRSAAQDIYADAEYYRSVFVRGWPAPARSNMEDAPSRYPFAGDNGIFGPGRQPTNLQYPDLTRDPSLDRRRGTLPPVNPNIYDLPVDPVNRPDQDSNYPRHTPEEAPPRNPEDPTWRGGDREMTAEAENGSIEGDSVQNTYVASSESAAEASDIAIAYESGDGYEGPVEYAAYEGGGDWGYDEGYFEMYFWG